MYLLLLISLTTADVVVDSNFVYQNLEDCEVMCEHIKKTVPGVTAICEEKTGEFTNEFELNQEYRKNET